MDSLKHLFKDKNIFVTGGLGSIGSAIVKEVLQYEPKSVVVGDNRETAMFYGVWENKDPRLKYVFMDVRDRERLHEVLRGMDIVFHAAAMKHILVCERNPSEAAATNVTGTQNVIDATIHNNLDRMVFISTDKVVNPTNVLGMTKLQAERLVEATCMSRTRNHTKFGVVRFGNVLYSQGSVLEIWERQLKRGEKISITDPKMTRFIMSTSQAAGLIFAASRYMQDGEIFIFKMPSCTIDTLAKAYLELRGYKPDRFEVIGAREGDRQDEELLLEEETKLLMENDRFLLCPPVGLLEKDIQRYQELGFKKSQRKLFSSNNPEYLLEKGAVKKILARYFKEE
ncbi:MAG: polysaccharide biosynthesis protein [Candidatus Colwellbacteria bacterium]|nr:polysaccharide biosynthesis protein [Candidatus Colwellbacteria bacterium]